MFEASKYERGTNLRVGDTFTLPEVKVGDKVYKPNDRPEDVKTGPIGSKARIGKLKQYKVQYRGGGAYVVDVTDPKKPVRVTGLLPEAKAQEELNRLVAEAEKAGKKRRPKEQQK